MQTQIKEGRARVILHENHPKGRGTDPIGCTDSKSLDGSDCWIGNVNCLNSLGKIWLISWGCKKWPNPVSHPDWAKNHTFEVLAIDKGELFVSLVMIQHSNQFFWGKHRNQLNGKRSHFIALLTIPSLWISLQKSKKRFLHPCYRCWVSRDFNLLRDSRDRSIVGIKHGLVG